MQMEHSCSLSHQVRSSEAAKEKLCACSLCEQGWDGNNDILILNKMNVISILLCAERTAGFGMVFFLMQKEAWRLFSFNSATEIITAL